MVAIFRLPTEGIVIRILNFSQSWSLQIGQAEKKSHVEVKVSGRS